MAVKVAINGFGRIGRLAFRQMFGAEGYDVVAINDLTKPSMLADLLKYDTAQGGYCGKIGENLHTVEADDEANTITVDGKTLTIYKEADASKLPWGKIGVDVVLEKLLQKMTKSSLLHLAQQTAWHLWQMHLTNMLPFRAVLCLQSTLTQATR